MCKHLITIEGNRSEIGIKTTLKFNCELFSWVCQLLEMSSFYAVT